MPRRTAAPREGLGTTLIHSDAIVSDQEAGHLEVLEVEGTPLTRPWHAVTTRTPTPTARLFQSHITDPDRVGDKAFRGA
ncbi:hypothetical protein ACQP1O_23665 [Nocardia sp. CA-151230]|uniref:hypothetical protein n=1 Tax=Nocardia sp. CA-151230 TaxID=3239982 RepID=UPI003D8CF6F5